MSDGCTIVAVCGSPGSGKSTFTLALGQALAAKRKKTVCLGPDPLSPALPFWLPSLCPAPGISASLGALLQYTVIDPAALANCLLPYPGFRDLAVMGNEYGCCPGRYDMTSRRSVNTVLELLRSETDFLIVDCCTDVKSDLLSHTAFSSADCAVCLLTPDCKGLSWLATCEARNLDLAGTVKVFNPVLRESPLSALQERVPDIGFSLPYSDEVALRMCGGRPLSGFQKQAGSFYEAALSSFAAKLIAMKDAGGDP